MSHASTSARSLVVLAARRGGEPSTSTSASASANARPRAKINERARGKFVEHEEAAFLDDVGTVSRPRLREPAASCPAKALPKLIVYDLDDTVWFPELYMISGAPFTKLDAGHAADVRGEVVGVYPAARASMSLVREHEKFKLRGTQIAFASRTHRGKWARWLMDAFELEDGVSMSRAASWVDIASGSKVHHFARLRDLSRARYDEMLFFDNERQNCVEVANLGVRTVYCNGGFTADAWRRGLRLFLAEDALRDEPSES